MRVGAVQLDVVWHDVAANLARVRTALHDAASAGVTFAVLPEMFATGFSMDAERAAADGPAIVEFLRREAAELGLWVAGSVAMPGRDGARPTNRFVAASPDGQLATYDKRHPFSYAGEHEAYEAGDQMVSFDADGIRCTPFVCYDLRFGIDFWDRAEATDLYVVVANWPTARISHWTTLLRARAVENQAYVVGVNRIGEGGGIEHGGATVVVDPMGEVLADAGERATTLIVDVDAAVVADVRRRLPFLADRRPLVAPT